LEMRDTERSRRRQIDGDDFAQTHHSLLQGNACAVSRHASDACARHARIPFAKAVLLGIARESSAEARAAVRAGRWQKSTRERARWHSAKGTRARRASETAGRRSRRVRGLLYAMRPSARVCVRACCGGRMKGARCRVCRSEATQRLRGASKVRCQTFRLRICALPLPRSHRCQTSVANFLRA
jgi:hypothetical protein